MTGTRHLIESLVSQASPVRPLPSPAVRTLTWLLFAVAVIAVLALLLGPRPDLDQRLRQPGFCLGLAASAATGALAALAAFIASLPDRSRVWLVLPLPAACIWVATVGHGCLTDWVRLDGAAMQFGETARCFATLLLSSVPLSVLMFWMLRHAARLRPDAAVLMGSLAVAALTATALSLLHEFDASIMILGWNLGVAVLVIAIDATLGRRLLPAWDRDNRLPAHPSVQR